MSDDQGWAAPSGPDRAPEPPAPPVASPWASPAPPSAPPPPSAGWSQPSAPPAPGGQSGWGPTGPAAGAPGWGPAGPTATGWTPPPKPGLVPLRPMTLGTILGAIFQVMRRNPLPTFGLALLLYGGGGLLSFGLGALIVWVASSNQTSTYFGGDDQASILAAVVGSVAAALGVLVINFVTTSIVQGVVVLEVARGTLGERLRLSGLWRLLRPRLGRMVGWLVLETVAAALAIGILIGIIAALSTAGSAGIALAVLFGIVGFLGLGVVAVWLGIKLVFTVPAIVLEGLGIRAAMARSWSLTRGRFWRTFGILLLVSVIYSVAGQVISVPVSLIGSVLIALVTEGSGDSGSAIASTLALTGVTSLIGFVIGAVGLVMLSACVALLYIDTRMRTEGLDQELARAAEARAAGTLEVDPYAPRAAPASPWA